MKLKLFPRQAVKSQQGFTIVETMTGAVISFLFLGLGANLVVAANIQKVVAKRNVAMNTAVESDMEMIQYQANQIAKDKELCTINPGTGYANELSKNISETSATLKILNHNYTMTRKIDTITDANVLPISYEFTREGSKTPDYQMYVEVIPNAALTCPSKLSPSV